LFLALCCLGPGCDPQPVHGISEEPVAASPLFPRSCKFAETAPQEIGVAVTTLIGGNEKEQYKRVLLYLSDQLKIPFRLLTFESMDEIIAAMESGIVHLASLSPLAYVRARDRIPCMPLLLTQVSSGTTHYVSYLMVRNQDGPRILEECRGKKLALVSQYSTSGYLLPMDFFLRKGISPDTLFSQVIFTNDHVTSLRMLEKGTVDVVATYSEVVGPARASGVDTSAFRVLAITGRTPYDALVSTDRIPRDLALRITDALAGLNTSTPEGRKILTGSLDLNGWVRTSPEIYRPLAETWGRLLRSGVQQP
jgi:phosphonate transport system substrate-binding protein